MSDPTQQRHRRIRWINVITTALALSIVAAGIVAYIGASGSGHHTKGRTSLATATALESAINGIYTEYGKLPDVGSRVTTNSPAGLKLLNILLVLDDKSDNPLNSRAIKFLNVREGKNHKNGLIFTADGKSIEGLYDPWGSPYTVILDTEYKEQLHFTLGSKTVELKGRRSTAFSPGPDKQLGTSDDVTTW
jgi:hypothetical protein